MRTLQSTLALVLCLSLTACGSTRPAGSYGSYLSSSAPLDQGQVARDAAQQLSELHPPAKTFLHIAQPTPDAFGQALVADLRARGYGVAEYSKDRIADASALELRYVLDQAGDTNLFRVTVWTGANGITRAYGTQGTETKPAGNWVHQE